MNKKHIMQSHQNVSATVDAGLRQYMLNVFSYMSGGLAVTALVAYFVSTSAAVMSFLFFRHYCTGL